MSSTNPELVFQTKSEFRTFQRHQREFVVTRFQEPLTWIQGLEHLTTVYNKGSPLDISANVIEVPNVGAGLETMLRHIIIRYDSLAEITMFCQGTLLDRDDQPLYPLDWYFKDMPTSGVKGVVVEAWDRGDSRFPNRLSDPNCAALQNRTLAMFRRDVVGISYKPYRESWVRGDWISVTAATLRKKPRAYYCYLYDACQFQRGIFTEELWYLERSWYSILTRPLDTRFVYPSLEPKVLKN